MPWGSIVGIVRECVGTTTINRGSKSMKTTVKVPVTTRTMEDMDVEFPLYRKVETKSLFVRVDIVGELMRECAVLFKKNGQIVLKIDSEYVFEDAELGYLLGTDEYESNEDEFLEALRKVQNTITYISGKPA